MQIAEESRGLGGAAVGGNPNQLFRMEVECKKKWVVCYWLSVFEIRSNC